MRNYLIILLILLACACKKSKKEQEGEALPPEKAVLIFPARDEACTSGKVISAAESALIFRWTSSANTESYELTIKDLESGISRTLQASQTDLEVVLPVNRPFSWYVTSKSGGSTETASSEVWKFYNSGPGVLHYAPFPAELLSPAFGSTVTAAGGKVTLDWSGSDADVDITSYDVYLGTSESPELYRGNIRESILPDVVVSAGKTYFWKVLTRDAKGNTSWSELYQFKVSQ